MAMEFSGGPMDPVTLDNMSTTISKETDRTLTKGTTLTTASGKITRRMEKEGLYGRMGLCI
jgi:hypothetical protein